MPKSVNYYLENYKLRFEPHEVFEIQSAAPNESAAPPKRVPHGALFALPLSIFNPPPPIPPRPP